MSEIATGTDHEDLCLLPLGAEVCTCDLIREKRESTNPWGDIMTTVAMEAAEHELEHEKTIGAARVEAASIGHSKDCAAWIWADRGLPCDCGLETSTIQGEIVREHNHIHTEGDDHEHA